MSEGLWDEYEGVFVGWLSVTQRGVETGERPWNGDEISGRRLYKWGTLTSGEPWIGHQGSDRGSHTREGTVELICGGRRWTAYWGAILD